MPKTSVSGFTRSEKFIMESLLDLKASKENLEDRVTRLEVLNEVRDKQAGAPSPPPAPSVAPAPPGVTASTPAEAAASAGWDARTKFWVAIISAIGTALLIVIPVLVTQCGGPSNPPSETRPAVEQPAPSPGPQGPHPGR